MKHMFASATAAGFCGLLALSSPAFAQSDSGSGTNQGGATAESCQPLNASNRDVCCNAPNWSQIIRSEDAAFCPSGGSDDKVRLGREFPEGSGNGNTDNTQGGGSGTGNDGTNNNGGSSNN